MWLAAAITRLTAVGAEAGAIAFSPSIVASAPGTVGAGRSGVTPLGEVTPGTSVSVGRGGDRRRFDGFARSRWSARPPDSACAAGARTSSARTARQAKAEAERGLEACRVVTCGRLEMLT